MAHGFHTAATITITDLDGRVIERHDIHFPISDKYDAQQAAKDCQAAVYKSAQMGFGFNRYNIFTNWYEAKAADAKFGDELATIYSSMGGKRP